MIELRARKIFVSILSSLLLIATLVTCFAVTGAAIGTDYDFSRPGSSITGTINSADILEEALGEPLDEAEREYLALHGELKILYDKGISTSLIVTEYDGENITVFASKYTYTTATGNTVSFVPELCEYNGLKQDLVETPEGYSCVFTSANENDADTAAITYALEVEVTARDINKIINQAFNDAPALKEKLEDENRKYALLKAEYDSNVLAYEEYLEELSKYEADMIEYTEYLTEKKLYEDALSEYNKYLADIEAYDRAVEDYREYNEKLTEYNLAYADYRNYLDELLEYEGELSNYNVYLDRMETVKAQLAVIDAAKINMTDSRQVYSAIMGNLVTQVLTENKDILVSDLIGADRKVIEAAETATENLRILLPYYFSLVSEQEKYTYYTINYEAFRDNFKSLAEALDTLYANKRIRAELRRQGRDRKYIILVAQLILITNGLSDGKVYNKYTSCAFDSTYRIEGQSVASLLENKTYFTDDDSAAPLATGYPSYVAEPTPPEHMDEPIKPTRVQIPAYPEEVSHPGDEPESVDKPDLPSEVNDPGDEPVKFQLDTASINLIAAYEEGSIKRREESVSGINYKITSKVNKKVFGSSLISIVFRDSDGRYLYSTEIDKGSFAIFEGGIPEKNEDASATYIFAGWTVEQGSDELFNLSEINEDAVLYPVFSKNPKSYTVKFRIENGVIEKKFVYGQAAIFEGVPQKESEKNCDYVFSGWDKPLGTVTEDTEYVAQFKRVFLVYGSDTDVGATVTDSTDYILAEARHLGDVLNADGALRRAVNEGKGLVLVTSRGTVTVSYTNALAMILSGHTVITVKTVQIDNSGYRYRVSVSDLSGGEGSYRLSVDMPCSLGEDGHMTLKYSSGEDEVPVNHTYNGEILSFILSTGIDYILKLDYELTVLPSKHASVSLRGDTTTPGSIVYVDCEVNEGAELVKVYLILSDGSEIEVVDGSFRMPKSDVSLGVVCKENVYTVTFVDGDRVISIGEYKYGEEVVLPSAPSRLNDSKFSYTFDRWSPKINAVTGDVTYRAVYKLELLPKNKDSGGLKISASILRLIIAAIVGAAMLLFVVVPSSVIAAVKVRKYRKIFSKNVGKESE